MSFSSNPDSSLGGPNGDNFGCESYQSSPRGRAIKSCLECRRRKMRCSRSQPCQNCSRFSRACVYLPYPDWPQNFGDSLSRQISSKSESPPLGSSNAKTRKCLAPQTPLMISGFESEPDPPALHDGFHDMDNQDESLDGGLQIGRMVITDRVGELFRPQVASEVSHSYSLRLVASSTSIGNVSTRLTLFTDQINHRSQRSKTLIQHLHSHMAWASRILKNEMTPTLLLQPLTYSALPHWNRAMVCS